MWVLRMAWRNLGVLLLTLAAAGATGAAAAGKPNGAAAEAAGRYGVCMSLARKDPERARFSAVAWRDGGGGDPARHCLAVALLGLGHYQEAARRLEELARSAGSKARGLRGELLAQAANAWLIAGQPEAAYAVQSAALVARPDDIELLIDRAISLASTARFWEAIDDLNRALELDPRRVDALVFRATAYRRVDSLELAQEDVGRALAVAPYSPDALLERGIVLRLTGDGAGARRDWRQVLSVAPRSAAADVARRNLERMDVRVE